MRALQPDLVLTGGTLLTMDGAAGTLGRRVGALAVAGGRILALAGSSDDLPRPGPRTRVVDLRGAAVLPGFQDQHAHPLVEGLRLGWVDLASTPDLAAGLRRLADAAARERAAVSSEGWVEAWYDPDAWREQRGPTRDELDHRVPDVPVLLHHASGHQVVANSVGLAACGITGSTADPPGASIGRDASGEPTGIVTGSDPIAPFAAALPPLTPESLRAALVRAGGRLAADGVTSVADADLGGLGDPISELAAYAGAVLDRALPQRVVVMPALTRLATADEDPPTPDDIAALVPPDVRERLRVGPAKLFADGALTTRDAWLRDPYADGGRGAPALDPDELVERVRRAHAAGWQVATHAIGDAGVELALRAYRAALEGRPRPDHRHRIEHAIVLPGDLLEDMTRLGVVAMAQPGFVAWNGDAYLVGLGTERARDVYPFRRWLDARLAFAFSSDAPFGPSAPLEGIRSSLRLAGPSGRRLHQTAGFSPADALRAWTFEAARAARDEHRTGLIRPGLPADLAVLSGDPTRIDPSRYAAGTDSLAVLATIVEGEIVFDDLDG